MGNPKVLQWATSKPARHLPCRDTFSLLYWTVTCSPLWEKTPSPSFQAVHYHYTNIPEKRVQNICYQYLCLQDILQNCLPTMFFSGCFFFLGHSNFWFLFLFTLRSPHTPMFLLFTLYPVYQVYELKLCFM